MEMKPVKSSNIKAAGYDPLRKVMRVQFSNGSNYDYSEVDATTFNNFMEAKSQGKFFHQNIKGKLTGTRVEGVSDDKRTDD